SEATSLGLFVTADTYSGSNGYSLRLRGLDADGLAADVVGAVHDDGAIPRHVIHPLLQSAQAEGIAVAAAVRVGGDEETERGRLTAGLVGEEAGQVAAAALAMSAELAVEQLARDEVEDEQPRLRRRQRVVDDRQQIAAPDQSLRRGAAGGVEGEFENVGAQPGRLLHQRGEERIPDRRLHTGRDCSNQYYSEDEALHLDDA